MISPDTFGILPFLFHNDLLPGSRAQPIGERRIVGIHGGIGDSNKRRGSAELFALCSDAGPHPRYCPIRQWSDEGSHRPVEAVDRWAKANLVAKGLL